MISSNLKTWLQNTIKSNVETLDATDDHYKKTLASDLIFYADGETCNLTEWMARMRGFKKQLKLLKVTFQHIIAEDDTVAAIYLVSGTKNDGSEMTTKVIAFFKIKNEKIIYVDELTRVEKGSW